MADTYKIVSQKQNVEINPSSTGFHNVWEVTYTVISGPAKGVTATVTVPDSDHNAAYVNQAILDKIADLHAIHSLGSD